MAVRASKAVSPEEYSRILAMRKERKTIADIAKQTGRAKSTIQYLLKNGHHPVGRPSSYTDTINRILHLRQQNLSLKETGDYLGLADRTIYIYIKRYEQMANQ